MGARAFFTKNGISFYTSLKHIPHTAYAQTYPQITSEHINQSKLNALQSQPTKVFGIYY
ncbi:hypothetical protein TUM4630_36270 [Shewanella algidipiscicola]|uniref:Uncharacterized protein n=1 Tax=Shewanella algidipiscicola TaxID=614070 RepID=A0ABQ4NUG4_9GAMM|nr:hypothetical protein TUM4630_36270 [Shewanella algidipiscicola]